MNRFKFFGARPVLYFAEPAAVGGGDAGGAASGGSGGGSAASAPGMSAAEIAAPGGDIAFLEKDVPSTPATEKPAEGEKPAEKTAAEEAKPEEINLSTLEDGKPEWLAK